MASTFTWLDYSERERRTMLDVIELFGDKTTRDELGIGGIRDAFADLLFPGTSTIQTAAKYFLLVPWVYQALERKRVTSDKAQAYARALEIKVAKALTDSGETRRVIGSMAKEKLRRLPSGVYWQGLQTWGIRRFSGFPDAYYRSLDQYYLRLRGSQSTSADFDGESYESLPHHWDQGLPEVPHDFPNGVELKLSQMESEYLRERVLTNCSSSLLAFLLRERTAINEEAFVWEIPLELPKPLAEWVEHGRLFSEVMHGAQLLYNLILAEMKSWQEKIDAYRAELVDWCELLRSRKQLLDAWNLDQFWSIVRLSNPRISLPAQLFVANWLGLVRGSSDLTVLIESPQSRSFVSDREIRIKRNLARVLGGRPLEIWQGESGAAQLDLRWRSARRILEDILTGVEAANLVGTE